MTTEPLLSGDKRVRIARLEPFQISEVGALNMYTYLVTFLVSLETTLLTLTVSSSFSILSPTTTRPSLILEWGYLWLGHLISGRDVIQRVNSSMQVYHGSYIRTAFTVPENIHDSNVLVKVN